MTEGAASIDNPVDITTIRPFVGSAVSGAVTISNDDSSTTFVGSLGNQNGGLGPQQFGLLIAIIMLLLIIHLLLN